MSEKWSGKTGHGLVAVSATHHP